MKIKVTASIFLSIFLISVSIPSSIYETNEIKIYKQLNKIDSIISSIVHEPNQLDMSHSISLLQQTFESLVETGISFNGQEDISESFNQFNLSLEISKQLEQNLTNLFVLDEILNLDQLQQSSDTLNEIIHQEKLRIQQLKIVVTILKQINDQLSDMHTIFYSKQNNEVFTYINAVREYFTQLQSEFVFYSQLVNKYMELKSSLYSQIK